VLNPGSEDQAESPDAVARVALELTLGSEPIRGFIEDSGGRHAFAGWIDLVDAIAASAERGRGDASHAR
jgi:hypothetical protein